VIARRQSFTVKENIFKKFLFKSNYTSTKHNKFKPIFIFNEFLHSLSQVDVD